MLYNESVLTIAHKQMNKYGTVREAVKEAVRWGDDYWKLHLYADIANAHYANTTSHDFPEREWQQIKRARIAKYFPAFDPKFRRYLHWGVVWLPRDYWQ